MGHGSKTPTQAFGEALQELRAERGWTQEFLADKADTERSHVSALERAEKGPRIDTILAFAKAFGISASDLMGVVERKLQAVKRRSEV